jgi:hypothetical protein
MLLALPRRGARLFSSARLRAEDEEKRGGDTSTGGEMYALRCSRYNSPRFE